MVEWYWLVITAWVAGAMGLLIGALCAASKRAEGVSVIRRPHD